MEIQEEIHHFAVLGAGGERDTKIVNKHFVSKLALSKKDRRPPDLI